MYVLIIEFDRTREGTTRRESRIWTFWDRKAADLEAERFATLAQAGSINFLRNGDRLTFQECRLFEVDESNTEVARQRALAGDARLLRHAFNPALDNPTYWQEFLAELEREEGDE